MGRRAIIGGLAGLGILLTASPSALGATVSTGKDFDGNRAAVVLRDQRGQVNSVTAVADLSGHREVVTLRDAKARIHAGRGCVSVGAHSAVCRLERLREIRFRLGGGRDRLEVEWFKHPYPQVVDADGGAGTDRLRSHVSAVLSGGPDDDDLVGMRDGKFEHEFCGGDGDDRMAGGPDDDVFWGGGGDDLMQGGRGDDYFYGRDCARREVVNPGRDRFEGGPGDDVMADWDGFGSRRGEEYEGPPTRVDRDVLVGGTGDDTVESYFRRAGPVVVDLSDRRPDGEAGERDKLVNVEDVIGSEGADRIIGDRDSNWLDGGDDGMSDVVRGLGGADTFYTTDEDDEVGGGAGDDEFIIGEDYSGTPGCSRGFDIVSFDPGSRAGPLLGTDCERVESPGFALQPTPIAVDGSSITFAVLEWKCCKPVLELTEPNDPFTPFASAEPRRKRLVVDRPPGDTLRAIVRGLKKKRSVMVWRFRVQPGPG